MSGGRSRSVADIVGDPIEIVVAEFGAIAGDGVDRCAAVAFEAGDHVAVDVGHFLAGGRTVVERHRGGVGVDGRLDRRRQSVERGEDIICESLGEVVEVFVMVVRDDERVRARAGSRRERRSRCRSRGRCGRE